MRPLARLAVWSLLLMTPLAAALAQQTPAVVKVVQHGDGQYFTDASGMVLYVFDRDNTPGTSKCNNACAKQWPPLQAAADAQPVGDWAIFKREDDTAQWEFRGKPVYTFAGEGGPLTTFGDSIRGPWHVAMAPIMTPPEVSIGRTLLGTVLVDQNGRTLYRRDGKQPCDEKCGPEWKPLEAPWAAVANADWRPVARDDGLKQWSFKGDLLYTYAGDVKPGDTTGDGAGKEWRAAVLEPPEARPAWVTSEETDAGEVLSDPERHTIYIYMPNFGGLNPTGNNNAKAAMGFCDAACRGANFHPLAAADQDKPVGNWTIVEDKDDNIRQWAYKGRPIYTNSLDKAPGDFWGVNFGDISWKAIMRSGLPMQGAAPG